MSFGLIASRKGKPQRVNFSVGTERVLIAAADPNRKTLLIQNQGENVVFIGGDDVAATGAGRGYALVSGAVFTDDGTDREWWALASSGTCVLHTIRVA